MDESLTESCADSDLRAAMARLRHVTSGLAQERPAHDGDAVTDTTSYRNGSDAAPQASELQDRLRVDIAARRYGLDSPFDIEFPPLEARTTLARARASAGLERETADTEAAGGQRAIEFREAYSLDELLAFPVDAFVRNAYRAILRREPDSSGSQSTLDALRRGQASRIDVLVALRLSQEGRRAGVAVHGLRFALWAKQWSAVPLLGRCARFLDAVTRVPALERWLGWHASETDRRTEADRAHLASLAPQVDQLQASALVLRRWVGLFAERVMKFEHVSGTLRDELRATAGRDELVAVSRSVETVLALLEEQAAQASLRGAALAGALDQLVAQSRADDQEVRVLVQAMDARLSALAVQWDERQRDGLQMLIRLDRAFADFKEGRAPSSVSGAVREQHDGLVSQGRDFWEDFYVAFENRFRGTRVDIKERLRVYLPVVEAAVARSRGGVVLDVGCGRGELLELLGENGIVCRGVDLNGAMVRKCRELNLDALEVDALAYLNLLPENTLAAVIGTHIIEHLRFADLTSLFGEVFRVLKPGGVVIFETPNPENLMVGAFSFWYDPTHVHPLPPELVRHLAETKGFARAEILRLHPNAEWERLPAGVDDLVRSRLNDLLYSARDYSIIAYKP